MIIDLIKKDEVQNTKSNGEDKMNTNTQLEILVKNSGLETTKSQYILEKFTSYFQLASEWEVKAKTLKVTDASQVAEMKMAREARLFLAEKRRAIETSRKSLKEQSLREGKAIDGIANVLKGLIEPIEKYLDDQEHFVVYQEQAIALAKQVEIERLAEVQRIEKEKAEIKERERIQKENEALKIEAEKREAQMALERKEQAEKLLFQEKEARKEREKQDLLLAKEREKAKLAKEKADAEKKAIEEKNRKASEIATLKARQEKEKILAEERAKAEVERIEKERLERLLANQIECPHCHKKFELIKKGS